MLSKIIKNKSAYAILGFYFLLVGWWTIILFSGTKESTENYLFGFIYALIALIGGVNGLFIARKWGGMKSLIGKGIIFFALGLLGLFWGQTIWSYYNLILKVEVPYPSLADIGFFSIIPFYSLGMLSFARASGVKFSLKKLGSKIIVILLPVIVMAFAYYMFVQNIEPDFTDLLRTFLDFGYPLGETIPISLALITYFLSKDLLGGKMKNRIVFIVAALIVHIITEYSFIYTAAAGIYYNAGPVDLMYMTSFALMSLALLSFGSYD